MKQVKKQVKIRKIEWEEYVPGNWIGCIYNDVNNVFRGGERYPKVVIAYIHKGTWAEKTVYKLDLRMPVFCHEAYLYYLNLESAQKDVNYLIQFLTDYIIDED